MKFKPIVTNKREQQSFDLNFKIKQRGQEFNLYDSIQEAREDTEIYPTLEKYGCLEKVPMDPNKVYADFRGLGDLKDMKLQQIKAQEMWNALPWDIRKEFNNDKYLFAKDGEKYLQNKIAEITKQNEVIQPTTGTTTTTPVTPATGTEVA